jgi:hypothetical protein
MVSNSRRIAGAPSRRFAEAPSHPFAAAAPRLAELGLRAVVRERGRAVPAAEGGHLVGIQPGGGNAAAGYLPDGGGAFRRGPLAGNPIQASPIQAGVGTKSTAQISTVQNSTDKHNSIQMTRLVPASWGELGPHRGKEPGPA